METKTHMRWSSELQIQEERRHNTDSNTIHHNEGTKKNFPQKSTLPQFVSTKPTLQRMPEGKPRMEENDECDQVAADTERS